METVSPYQTQERYPVQPSARHTVLRSYPSEQELQRAHQQIDNGWTHIRPNSVLVASMGNHWRQGSWNKVVDMIEYTQEQGIYCALSEIQDRCFDPYDALGTMRNEAILAALGEGFQWLLYIDNDVKPEKDALVRLLQWQMPIVAPYIVENGTGVRLFGPNTLQPNSGLHRAKWSVLSMLLFHSGVLHAIGPDFWRDAVGADEGFHFAKLHYYSFYLFIDTNIQLEVGGRPLYPLALNRLSSGSIKDIEQAAKVYVAKIASVFTRKGIILTDADQLDMTNGLVECFHNAKGDRELQIQQKIERFVEAPDRRAIDPQSPWVKDGEYAPFLIKAEKRMAESQKASAGASMPIAGTNGTGPLAALAFTQAGYGR